MKEQSHKEEMSSLLKADFDRLRARGVASTLAPAEPAVEVEPDPPAQDPEAAPTTENVLELEQPVLEEQPAASSGGWFRRLLGSG